MSEQPPERPEEFQDYSDNRDLSRLGPLSEEVMERISQGEELATAQDNYRRLLDTKERGDRQISDEELTAAHEALLEARKKRYGEGTPQ